jgi:hypothetical protein
LPPSSSPSISSCLCRLYKARFMIRLFKTYLLPFLPALVFLGSCPFPTVVYSPSNTFFPLFSGVFPCSSAF